MIIQINNETIELHSSYFENLNEPGQDFGEQKIVIYRKNWINWNSNCQKSKEEKRNKKKEH